MQLKYRPEVDGLRALAVLPVILFHAGIPGFAGGYVGVDVFFVISGYLITSLIAAELQDGRFSLATFYERRARRILPALLAVLAVLAAVLTLWLAPQRLKDFGATAVSVATFSSNIYFWSQSGYFDAASDTKPLLHTWSLAVEEQYYLLFPIALMLLWRLGRKRVIAVVACVALASLALSEIMSRTHPVANFFLAPTRFWELLLGSLIALVPALRDRALAETQRRGDGLLAGLGLLLLGTSVCAIDEHVRFPSLIALFPTVGTALILTFAHPTTLAARFLSLRLIVGIGLVSYSAYLWHHPLLTVARLASPQPLQLPVRAALAVAAFPLAWLTWRFVEAPFRDRRRWRQPQVLRAAVVSLLVVAAAGAWIAHERGFAGRYPQLSSGWSQGREDCAYPSHGLDQLTCSPQLATDRSGATERRILFVGDSLLMSMSDGLRSAAAQTGVAINVAAHTGCPILLDTAIKGGEAALGATCMQYNQLWSAFARRHRITDLIIVSAFNRYIRKGAAAGRAGPAGAQPLQTAQQWTDALRDTVATLTRQGVRVAFMRQIPDFNLVGKKDVNDIVFAQVRSGRPVAVGMPRALYDADSAGFIAAVRAAGAEVLDAAATFCDDRHCSPVVGGRGLYADNDHVGLEGSAALIGFWSEVLKSRYRGDVAGVPTGG